MLILLPNYLKIKVLKQKKKNLNFIHIYSNLLYLNILNFNYDQNIHALYNNQPNVILFNKKIFYFFTNLIKYFFIKFFYQGKGYKIKKLKNFNILIFFFGYCHLVAMNFHQYKLKLKKKNFFFLYFSTFYMLKTLIFNTIKIKSWNIYTWRGIRLKKTIVFRKPKRKATFI